VTRGFLDEDDLKDAVRFHVMTLVICSIGSTKSMENWHNGKKYEKTQWESSLCLQNHHRFYKIICEFFLNSWLKYWIAAPPKKNINSMKWRIDIMERNMKKKKHWESCLCLQNHHRFYKTICMFFLNSWPKDRIVPQKRKRNIDSQQKQILPWETSAVFPRQQTNFTATKIAEADDPPMRMEVVILCLHKCSITKKV
jgi:hypothetical protein